MSKSGDGTYDESAAFWAAAYVEHYKRLYAMARRLLTGGNHAEAEDAVSEAFVRAMTYAKDPEAIANLFAYLWITVKRVWISKCRKEGALNMESLDELLATGQHPMVDAQALRILETMEFEKALEVRSGPLTPRENQLLELHLRGYSCDEMALLLGEDVRLVRSDLNAVRAKVRYRLTKGRAKTKGSGQS